RPLRTGWPRRGLDAGFGRRLERDRAPDPGRTANGRWGDDHARLGAAAGLSGTPRAAPRVPLHLRGWRLGRHLLGARPVDRVDRLAERGIEFGIAHLDVQAVEQRPAEARDHAVVPRQVRAGLVA